MARLNPLPAPRRASACLPGATAALLLALGLAGTAAEPDTTSAHQPLFPVTMDRPFPAAAATFEQVRKLLLSRYYTSTLTEDALYYAAIEGMLAHVSPPDTPQLGAIWAPEDYRSILDTLGGEQVSIGIASHFDAADGSLTVREVYPGSPAEGVLQPRDRIMRIDGQPLRGLDVASVNRLLSDTAGTTIALTVVRDVEVRQVSLTRQRFALQNVRHETLPGDIALITISRLTREVAERVGDIVRGLAGGNDPPAIIVDLRGNSGGLFVEGLKLAELFIGKPQVLLRALQSPERVANYVSDNADPVSAQVIVLLDRESASASEIFAAAMQAHGLARLVGTTSFGKATLEETFRLDNDYRVKFIVGAMYDPRGRSWYRNGLVPDFFIEQKAGLHKRLAALPVATRLGRDPQLNAAWKLLRDSATP